MKKFVYIFLLTWPFPAFSEANLPAIKSSGYLSPMDLYLMVSCGKPKGGVCAMRPLRWDRKVISLALPNADADVSAEFVDSLQESTDLAIKEINSVAQDIKIERVQTELADIIIRPSSIPVGTQIPYKETFSRGGEMELAVTSLWWNNKRNITRAVVLVSDTIKKEEAQSIITEEIFQSLGLFYNIENPDYKGLTIMAEGSNTITKLGSYDAMLLRQHYLPPQNESFEHDQNRQGLHPNDRGLSPRRHPVP